MNLLMYTQSYDRNHSIQGFTHNWVESLSSKVKNLYLIANEVGNCDPPENLTYWSLGKEKGTGKPEKFFRLQKFSARLILVEELDGIFVHQIEHYGLCVWPLARMAGVPIVQFKAHKGVPLTLRVASYLFDHFVTSSQEGLELPSSMKTVIGQGINLDRFRPNRSQWDTETFRIVSVGRISPIKDYETLIEGIDRLTSEGFSGLLRVKIVGAPGKPEQESYLTELKEMVQRKGLEDIITFMGSVPYRDVPEIYRKADLFVNLSRTGSLDKAVLEAMACECPVITANWAYREVFPSELEEKLMIEPGDSSGLAEAIRFIHELPDEDYRSLGGRLRSIVQSNHGLDRFMNRLVEEFRKLQ